MLILLVPLSIRSQVDISRLSLDFGIARNYQFGGDHLYSLYPEIKLGGKFYSEILEWEILLGYWDDGITKELSQIMDHTTFSHSNLTFGSKFYFLPGRLKFHLFLSGGFSYKYVYKKYIGGGFSMGKDSEIHLLSMDLGVGFRYTANPKIRIRTELNAHLSILGNIGHLSEYSNGSIKIGLDYFFKQ